VLSGKSTRSEVFLAHLFTGRLDEDAGRLDEAAHSYAAALALEVTSQSARLALSHVRPAGARLRPDPFWLYPWEPSVSVVSRSRPSTPTSS
jgi:hypothetical protein